MSEQRVRVTYEGAVAYLGLNRPEQHNALDEPDVHDAHRLLDRLVADPAVRVIVVTAPGPSFCAGADLRWMQRGGQLDASANLADARQLPALLYALATAPKPVVARVQGDAYGGGVGLIAACDIAIGVDTARFALTEVRLGLAAAVIYPYLLDAIGPRQLRRLILTGERFDAQAAARFGLLHHVVAPEALDATLAEVIARLLEGGPRAQAAAKDALLEFADESWSPRLTERTARRLAEIRSNSECREGIAAFLEARHPAWDPRR